MPTDIPARVFNDLLDGQRTVLAGVTDVRFQARILLRRRFDLIHKQRLFGVTDGVVEVHVAVEVAIQVADEGQERRQADTSCDPDLFRSASLVVEQTMRAFDDGVHAGFEIAEQGAGEVPARFDGDPREVRVRRRGDREGMRLVQRLVRREAHEEELSRAGMLDAILFGAQDNFRR